MSASPRTNVALLAVLLAALLLLGGCAGNPSPETPSGTISVSVVNDDDAPHAASVVVHRNGTAVTELRADAVQPGDEVRFESNETGQNFTIRVESGPSTQSFDWSPARCSHRVVNVTIGSDSSFETTDECRSS